MGEIHAGSGYARFRVKSGFIDRVSKGILNYFFLQKGSHVRDSENELALRKMSFRNGSSECNSRAAQVGRQVSFSSDTLHRKRISEKSLTRELGVNK